MLAVVKVWIKADKPIHLFFKIKVMNKLVFTLRRNWGSDLVLIANNHKDLEDHLNENYDWYNIEMKQNTVRVTTNAGYESEFATLEWVKHI